LTKRKCQFIIHFPIHAIYPIIHIGTSAIHLLFDKIFFIEGATVGMARKGERPQAKIGHYLDSYR
ncbi:hypothetical protein, partial [Enterocloster bolteae]|uniref:hypothetical protein n=1 Tax=Enterocloster bolteae TaxID=208479 RepID=UPI002A7F395B